MQNLLAFLVYHILSPSLGHFFNGNSRFSFQVGLLLAFFVANPKSSFQSLWACHKKIAKNGTKLSTSIGSNRQRIESRNRSGKLKNLKNLKN